MTRTSCWVIGIVILAAPLPAVAEEASLPFADRKDWLHSFEDGVVSQAASGKILLLFMWSEYDPDLDRTERDMYRWKGVSSLLDQYCKAAIRVEKNREFIQLIPIAKTPSMVLIDSKQGPRSSRIIGVLEDLEERSVVVSFLEAAFVSALSPTGAMGAKSSPPLTPEEALREAERKEDLSEFPEALELYMEALADLPESSGELIRKVRLKVADLNYKKGDFEAALRYYRELEKEIDTADSPEAAHHIFLRLALLLNDQGENAEAERSLLKRIKLESDEAKKEELGKILEAMRGGLFVLAGQGYPGVGGFYRGAGGGESEEDESGLSFEERLKKVERDLDQLESLLRIFYEESGQFPDYLEDLSPSEGVGGAEAPTELPEDPFLPGGGYQYLHLEEPEAYILYSVGPDQMDQLGDEVYEPEVGEEGAGDIVRRFRPE